MIPLNKIKWAKCPKCETLINDWQYYSAGMLMAQDRYYHQINCPKCKEYFSVRAVREVRLITEEEPDLQKEYDELAKMLKESEKLFNKTVRPFALGGDYNLIPILKSHLIKLAKALKFTMKQRKEEFHDRVCSQSMGCHCNNIGESDILKDVMKDFPEIKEELEDE